MNKSLSFVLIILFVLFVFLPVNAQEERGEPYYDFGVFAFEDKDYQGAEENFKKALEFNPDNPFYNQFLGKTYLMMERYDEAMSYLSRAWAVNPDISGLRYDIAYLNYKMSNYSKAADLFTEIVTEDPSNVLASYHAAISLFKLKRFATALDYFLAAAEMSPTIKLNGYFYAGLCFWEIGKIENAVEKLEYVRDHAESGSLRESSIKWLQAIETRKDAMKPLRLSVKLGYQYNDNVVLEPLDLDLFTSEDDYATVLRFSGRYNLVNRQDYQVGVKYNHNQTWYNSLDEYDQVGSTFDVYTSYRLDAYTLGLSYLPSYYWVDGESFLMRHQLKPDITWRIDKNLSIRLSYIYYHDDFFQNDGRDGHAHEGFIDLFYRFLDQDGLLFAGGGYLDNNATDPDYYFGSWKTRLGVSFNIPWELKLSLIGDYIYKDYDYVDSNYGIQREDDRYSVWASLSRKLFYDWLSIVGEYKYTRKDSNIINYNYKQNTTTLSLTAIY